MLAKALIEVEPLETNGQVMKITPEVDDSGSLQVGNGTRNMDFRVVLDSTSSQYFLCDVGNAEVTVNGVFWSAKRKHRTIVDSGVTILTEADFGKFIFSATSDKFLQFPDPVGNTGATLEVYQSITRNTTFQCVNATAAKFADTGDNAINSLRLNTFANRVTFISSGVDWLATPLGNTVNNIARNVPTSF